MCGCTRKRTTYIESTHGDLNPFFMTEIFAVLPSGMLSPATLKISKVRTTMRFFLFVLNERENRDGKKHSTTQYPSDFDGEREDTAMLFYALF